MNNRKVGGVVGGGVSLHSTAQVSGGPQNRSSGAGLVRSIWRGGREGTWRVVFALGGVMVWI